ACASAGTPPRPPRSSRTPPSCTGCRRCRCMACCRPSPCRGPSPARSPGCTRSPCSPSSSCPFAGTPPTPPRSSRTPPSCTVCRRGFLSSFAVLRPLARPPPRFFPFPALSGSCVCVCRHTPTPAAFFSHPAVVHRLPSLSVHGVLSSFAVQRPVAGTQPRLHSFTVQSVFCVWVWRHTPTPAAFFSHPAVVHRLPSVSVHGVLSSFGTHAPVVWSQPRLQSSTVQLGQIGMLFVCWLPEGWLRAHVASFDVVVYPAICSISAGVLSLNGPEAGSWLTT